MIRVAFTMLGGASWLGGRHYLLNLLRCVRTYQPREITPVLFVSDELTDTAMEPFREIDGVEIVTSSHFSPRHRRRRLAQALLLGIDVRAGHLFREHQIDVVFEPAQFYGWRLPMPAVAWVPDFQDRHLPHMFTRKAHTQKWLGQWIQSLTGRTFMMSSEDSRSDCERFYPPTRGRTRVVRFAVPAPPILTEDALVSIPRSYQLPERFFYLPNQIWAHKNHICVIRALKILKDDGHEVVVAATGNSSDVRHAAHFDSLMAEVSASRLTSNYRFLGVVPHTHVLALLQSAVALINPSLCEGWSTTVEEAKSTGTPMILSNLAVHREQAGDDALYFRPDSPYELATYLRDFRALTRSERAIAANKSRADAIVRMEEFARAFCETVRESLTDYRRGMQAQ